MHLVLEAADLGLEGVCLVPPLHSRVLLHTSKGVFNRRTSVFNTRPGVFNTRNGVSNTRPGVSNGCRLGGCLSRASPSLPRPAPHQLFDHQAFFNNRSFSQKQVIKQFSSSGPHFDLGSVCLVPLLHSCVLLHTIKPLRVVKAEQFGH